jgi:hypothetical protein
VNGTLTIDAQSYCYADGYYNFTWTSAQGNLLNMSASLKDGFNLCQESFVNATLHATLTPNQDSVEMGSKIYFWGEVYSTGLPLVRVEATDLAIFNTRPSHVTKRDVNSNQTAFGDVIPNFVHPIYNASRGLTDFAEKADWEASIIGSRQDFGAFGLATNLESWATVDTIVPFIIGVTPFAGSSLTDSFLTTEEAFATDLSMGLQMRWIGYFDVITAEQFGRRYLVGREASASTQVVKQVQVWAQTRIITKNAQIKQTPVATGSNALVIGLVVGGVVLLSALTIVAVMIGRRKKSSQRERFI